MFSIHPTEQSTTPDTVISDTHRTLGLAGLMPFIGLTLATLAGADIYRLYLLSYAALIFSFLGGVLWFVSLRPQAPAHITWLSVLMMLWAWSWLHPQFPLPVWIAALSFVALHGYERLCVKAFYPAAFMQLRQWLTLIASLSLIVAAVFGG